MDREDIGYVVAGILSGAGLNYFWEATKAPGYGITVIPVGPGFAVDDCVEIAVGAGIAVYGSVKQSWNAVLYGSAFVVGVFLTKVVEQLGGWINPIGGLPVASVAMVEANGIVSVGATMSPPHYTLNDVSGLKTVGLEPKYMLDTE